MVFQREEERAGCEAEDVVGGYVTVFPWYGFDRGEDWVAFLPWGDDDTNKGGYNKTAHAEKLAKGVVEFESKIANASLDL